MSQATVTNETAELREFVAAAKQGPVIVTRKGKPVAVMLSLRDRGDLERLLLARSPALRKIFQKADRQLSRGTGIPHDDFWNEVAKPSARRARKLKK